MRSGTQILVETTKSQKQALASVLKENGATLTEWFADNIAEATADFSVEPIETPQDPQNLEALADSGDVLRQLKRLDWAFSEDDTTYLSHDIHPYPAKFIPQIPRNLIARLSLPGETVWDPFGGSGTAALESVLLGRQAISSDLNPLAEVIGKAKVLTPTKEDDDFLTSLVEELFIVAASEGSVSEALNRFAPDIPNCDQWFHPNAVAELDTDRLSILLLCSIQSSERSQIEESLTGSREIRNGDRRELEGAIEDSRFDDVPSPSARAIVTKVHRLNKNADVGFRRKNMAALLLRYFADMTKVFRNLHSCLKPGASAFFVIGDNVTTAGNQEVMIKSGEVLAETAEELGWKIRERTPITVTTENRRHAKHSITENEIIWCQTPD